MRGPCPSSGVIAEDTFRALFPYDDSMFGGKNMAKQDGNLLE